MYEELIEALRLCVKYGKAEDALANASQATDAIEELQADKAALNGTVTNLLGQIKDLGNPRWISVTERLPEDGEYVLAYSAPDKLMFVAARHRFSEWNVTHWMPQTEPPKHYQRWKRRKNERQTMAYESQNP